MSYIAHHTGLVLMHRLSTDDRSRAELVSPDAELVGDTMTTRSADGHDSWPVCCATKKASHTSIATADSETWSAAGANELWLKKEVIPLLHQMENNIQRIAFIKRG